MFILFYYICAMENDKKAKKNDLSIVQPNSVTYARYDFDEREENVLTLIFDSLQKHLTKEKFLDKDIFNEFYVSITDFESSADKRNYADSLEKMQKKTVKFDWNKPDTGLVQTTATIFSAYHVHKNQRRIDITLNKWAIPYLLYWGKGVGGTIFNKTTALRLQGKYTKRMYKICCRWLDKGGFALGLDQLKEMLEIPKSYNISKIRSQVLEASIDELNETADVTFSYRFHKINGSRAFNQIQFKVFANAKNRKQKDMFDIENKGKEYGIIYKVVAMAYPTHIDGTAMMVADKLASDSDAFHKAYKRFEIIFNEIKAGASLKDKVGLIKHILDKDFGLNLMKKSNAKIKAEGKTN